MLLLDSLYINNGGGKILLDYLVEKLENSHADVFYIFDFRCTGDYAFVPDNRKIYLRASLKNRHLFYKKEASRFSSVFCFGNLPPTIDLTVSVYTYFQQRLFLDIPKNMSFATKILLLIKRIVFKSLVKNSDYFIIQTDNIKKDFILTVKNFQPDKLLVMPFFRPYSIPDIEKEINSFIYVSSGAEHKNHLRLLKAFALYYDKFQKGRLILTVENSYTDVFNKIVALTQKNYPILNLGFISMEELIPYYAKAEYAIYPSLTESFGLGVIEAIEAKCKVLGADLEYMHAVCKPSLCFNPYSIESIAKCFEMAVTEDLKPSIVLSENKVDDLIGIIIRD